MSDDKGKSRVMLIKCGKSKYINQINVNEKINNVEKVKPNFSQRKDQAQRSQKCRSSADSPMLLEPH